MVLLSSLLMAAGLASRSLASPARRSSVDTSEPKVIYPIGYSDTLSGGRKNPPVIPPPPTIRQFTPEEFQTWLGNGTNAGVVTERSMAADTIGPQKRDTITDTRYYQAGSAYPFGSMGRLYEPVPGGYAWCSGTLVGPRLMLSARHCIPGPDAEYALFEPGYNNGDVFPSAYVTEIVSLAVDNTIDNTCESKNDWALYVLSQPLGTQRGYMPLASYTADRAIVENQPVMFTAGYPGDLSGGQQLYMTDSRTTYFGAAACANGGPIYANAYAAGGMSGGPMWRRAGDTRYLYGNIVGVWVDGNGAELSTIHAWGDALIQGVNNLNAQFPN